MQELTKKDPLVKEEKKKSQAKQIYQTKVTGDLDQTRIGLLRTSDFFEFFVLMWERSHP